MRVPDQYGNMSPGDLVVLHLTPSKLSESELQAIDALDWYQPDRERHRHFSNLILVSGKAMARCLKGMVQTYSLEDAGLKHLQAVEKIEQCLHRWGDDMFYHA